MSKGHAGFSDEELHRLTVLQGMLGLTNINEAMGLEVKIAGLIKCPEIKDKHPAPDYEGFASEITGDNRRKLLQYIERVKESGIYD